MASGEKTAVIYAAMNESLDHALSLLLLKGNDFPVRLELDGKPPYACYQQIHEITVQRQQKLQRRLAKTKLSKTKAKAKAVNQAEEEEEEEEEERKEDEVDIPMRLTIVTKQPAEAVKKNGNEKGGAKAKAETVPQIKKLDLSGANLSPVITQPKPPSIGTTLVLPPSRAAPSLPIRVASVEVNRPLAFHSTSSAPAPGMETLQRLQRLPMLENLVADSSKHRTIVKWMEADDGKNKDASKTLLATINRLQKNGIGGPTNNNSKGLSRRLSDLSHKTLDDQLKHEGHVERKRKLRVKRGGGSVKREKRMKKLTTSKEEPSESRQASRKRPLNGFVVESDEEEYEVDDAWGGGDSEAEYESEAEEESSEEDTEMRISNFDAAVEGKKADVSEKKGSSSNGNGSPASPAGRSGKASPRIAAESSSPAPASGTASSVSATQQFERVVARIRAAEEEELAAAASGGDTTPTYLSYAKPPEAPAPVVKKEQKNGVSPRAASVKPLSYVDGTSESNAIVLDGSDDDEEEDDDSDADVPEQRVVAPPPAKTQPKAMPQPKAKAQVKTSPKPAKPRTKQVIKASTSNGAGKAKAPVKQKAKVSDDEEESEAEFKAPEEEGSSTDADTEMFDLNEEDVYVVESILQIKRGRTSLTNSGRTTKEADLFLVKWDGYNELTWEPDANIPKRLVDFFIAREAAKRECQYKIDEFLERRVAKNLTTGKDEIIYLIKWDNLPAAYWEVKANLPDKTVVWLEKTSRSSSGKISTGPSHKKAKK